MEKRKWEHLVISPTHTPPIMDSPTDDRAIPSWEELWGRHTAAVN